MSDFSVTARCAICGRRYAPDDGGCCAPQQCERCDRDIWHEDDQENGLCLQCVGEINNDKEEEQ